MNCERCGEQIPAIRLEVLGCCTTCVACSSERAKRAEDLELESGADVHDLVDSVHNEGN